MGGGGGGGGSSNALTRGLEQASVKKVRPLGGGGGSGGSSGLLPEAGGASRHLALFFSETLFLRGVLTREKKVFLNGIFATRPHVAHMFNHGWWQLAVGGWWQLVVGGWRLAVGGGW